MGERRRRAHLRPSRRGNTWCARWWDHPEAVLRLTGLWRSWEAAARDPLDDLGTSVRDHLDPGVSVLLSPTGPAAGCQDKQQRPPILPVAPSPPGWWSARQWWDVLDQDDP